MYQYIQNTAVQLETNVHVLLSSFAVLDETTQSIINMVIFVEGGTEPVLHAFAKNTASDVDFDYSQQYGLFTQQVKSTEVDYHAAYSASADHLSIFTGSVFESYTQGGACLTYLIDVCLDHMFGHAKMLMQERFLTDAAIDEILPEQVEQCITSCSVNIWPENVLADSFLHVDAGFSKNTLKYRAEKQEASQLEDHRMAAYLVTAFPNIYCYPMDEQYIIPTPAFGSQCKIDILSLQPAAHYHPEIRTLISAHNDDVFSQRWATARYSRHGFFNSSSKDRQKMAHEISNDLLQLKEKMLKRSQPSFLQRFYNSSEALHAEKSNQYVHLVFGAIQEHLVNLQDDNVALC